MRLFAEITKIDREQRLVCGYASTEALDSQGEVVRKEAIEAALPDYMRFANIREMHRPSAVGVAKEAEIDDKGLYLAARIIDDEAWRKVTEGVYKGFSIGGHVVERDKAQKNIITGVELLEISLVDRPANPEAVIELYKARGLGKVGARHSRVDLARVQGLHDTSVDLGASCPGQLPSSAAASSYGKVGARHSRVDLARVQKLHDTSVDLGASCPAAADGAMTAGAAGAAEKLARLAAEMAPLQRRMEALAKRLERLEAEPLPARAIAKAIVIGKEQDGGGASGERVADFVTRLAGLSPEQRAHELTKLALRLPQPLPR
jgi:HK97 family phage prohead protease